MTATVYVETSIPSFYHEVRTEPEMIARREWKSDRTLQSDRARSMIRSRTKGTHGRQTGVRIGVEHGAPEPSVHQLRP